MRFPHFSNSNNALDNNDPNSDGLWQLRNIVNFLNDVCSKYYALSELLTVDKVIVLLKNYIPKEHKHFRIKLFKLYDMSNYTYGMDVCVRKDRTCVTADVTATHICKRTDRKGGRT
jgi:hypothetical protein